MRRLTQATKEPLNVIISGKSDKYVLSSDGFASYYRAIGFAVGSCLGLSSNDTQKADLGDGNGNNPQAGIAREGEGQGCNESLHGGNHFRYWFQNGTKANTNAVFIAASVELPIKQDHMIAKNGYDAGRDQLVGNATQGTKTDKETGNQFKTNVVKDDTTLLKGISASDLNHKIGTDGKVKVLQVQLVKRGKGNQQQHINNGQTGIAAQLSNTPWLALAVLAALAPTALFL